MKHLLTLFSAVLLASAVHAQTPVTVSTQAGNAQQVWYSLQNGEVGSAALAEWDLAFEMTGFSSSIRVNTAKGLVVYETPSAIGAWDAVNSVDTANWIRVDNADTSWSVSALNNGNNLQDPDGFNVGWGNYNVVTHVITGAKIYVIALADGTTWKKLRINSLANGVYSFTYANLDGSGNFDAELLKSDFTGKNFGYWSFSTNGTLDREPLTAVWDLLFTKYTGFVPTPYPVSGVLQNKGVTALQVDNVPTADAEWTSGPLLTEMNIIGSDWKAYDFDLNQYTIAADRTYFVKDLPGNIWKIVLTAYGGSSTGDMSFNQELVSAVGIGESRAQKGTLLAFPNPVTNGQAQFMVDVPEQNGTLRVLNLSGQQMMEQQWTGLNGLVTKSLDVSGLARGMYILRFDSPNSGTTGKLMID
ncbi:MAG: T9SS type A sorting domain-containing protein [Flavobacteriales bacterium]|nr:T9SS type A sorting domain-containing protein [Flavobacteriales bacterium]